MGGLNTFWREIASMFQAPRIEDELADEMRVHLERLIAYNRRAGLSPEAAAREARRRLGGAWGRPPRPGHFPQSARHRAA